MGHGLEFFSETIDRWLICSICNGVMEHPLEVMGCEHYFCKACIEGQRTCPLDGNTITSSILRAAPRILKIFLARLTMRCKNLSRGCKAELPFEKMLEHMEHCEYDGARLVTCKGGCGAIVSRNELPRHFCSKEVQFMQHFHKWQLAELRARFEERQVMLDSLETELESFK